MAVTLGPTGITFSNNSLQTESAQGPAFLARHSGSQSVGSAAMSLCSFTSEVFDTDERYNNTGSAVNGIPAYAFLPNVAGYYQIDGAVYSQNNNVYTGITIRRNGSDYVNGTRNVVSTNALQVVGGIVYLNGTTDYVQIYFYSGSATVLGTTGAAWKHFSGHLVRPA